MADLANLLDELDRANEPEEELQNSVTVDYGDENPPVRNNDDDDENDGNNDNDLVPAVPPVLREAGLAWPHHGTVIQPPEATHRLDLQDLVEATDGEETKQQQLAYQRLKSWWIHELHAPELLPWQGELMDTWIQKLNLEEEQEDEEAEDAARQTHHQRSFHVRALLQSIHRIDRQNLSYIVGNLLSTRLLKIQKYHVWLTLEQQQQQDKKELGANDDLMGPAEQEFLKDYHSLWTQHMRETVTDHFPQSVWKALDEPEMVESPNLDQFVWVRFLEETTLHLSQSQDIMDHEDDDDDMVAHAYSKGTILAISYRQAREFIREGKAEFFI